jgi:molecular chaperone DnaK (HSP70)
MSYISAENQTLLWNTIQKVGMLHETIPASYQADWFREIVSMYYNEYKNRSYDLKQLNKETIGHMINSLRSKPRPDYDKATPPEPNFKEQISDGVIENMDELLQQQIRQRELDLSRPQDDLAELRRMVKKLQEELERKEHIIRLKDREIESLKLELDSLKK